MTNNDIRSKAEEILDGRSGCRNDEPFAKGILDLLEEVQTLRDALMFANGELESLRAGRPTVEQALLDVQERMLRDAQEEIAGLKAALRPFADHAGVGLEDGLI